MNKYFTFGIFPELEDDRLILKEILDKDAGNAVDLAVYDGFFPKNSNEVIQILEKIRADYNKGDGVSWGIYLKSTGELTGTCCYCRGFKDNIGEIGYVMKEKFRRCAIMTDACKLIIQYGFDVLKLDGVKAFTDPDNVASQGVLLRLGFKLTTSDKESNNYLLIK